jgi:signal transduction histidine kinase
VVVGDDGPTAYRVSDEHDGESFVGIDPASLSWLDAIIAEDSPAERLMRAAQDPYVLAIPVFPRGERGHAIYLRVSSSHLADSVLPELAGEYLGLEADGFEVALLDTSTDEVLYASEDVAASRFLLDAPSGGDRPESREADRIRPDVVTAMSAWPGSDPTLFRRFMEARSSSAPAARDGGGRSDEVDLGTRNVVVQQWLALRRADAEGMSPSRTPLPDQGRTGLVLLVWHSAGSIQRAVEQERDLNLLVSGAVLLFFGGVALVFHMLFTRAQRLREKEQEFVAGVTHELRTPVSAIHAVAENLAQGVVTRADRVREYGAALLDEGKRLRAMIDQTLAYAGLQAGQTVARGEIDVDELVRRAVSLVPELESRRLETSIAPGIPPFRGDRIALESILTNLLSNAAKHNPPGTSICVRVTAEATEPTFRLVIRVEDDGIGIPRSELRRVREPFFRGSGAQEGQVSGTGLGLNIVHRTVTMTGGKLDIESRGGSGTTVTVRLPYEN